MENGELTMDFLIIGIVLFIAIGIVFSQIKKIKKGNGCCSGSDKCKCTKK